MVQLNLWIETEPNDVEKINNPHPQVFLSQNDDINDPKFLDQFYEVTFVTVEAFSRHTKSCFRLAQQRDFWPLLN